MGRSRHTLGWWLAVGIAGLLLLAAGGSAVCTMTPLNCHIRDPIDWELSQVKGDRGGEVTLIESLRTSTVARDLDFPTDFDFLPDGRILIAERTGRIQLFDPESGETTTALDLRGRVSIWGLRGVVALAVEPPREGQQTRFYVVYSIVNPDDPDVESPIPTTARVSRFTMVGDTAPLESERVIIGSAVTSSCVAEPTSGCLPSTRDHIGADIVFLDDDTLLISTGDGGPAIENVRLTQSPDALGGKLLRVDRSGRGLSDNPYWNGDPTANRSKVWATGLRNPFRIAALPDGRIVVGDVGFDDREELSVVDAGDDNGWPCYEGTLQTPAFRATTFCSRYYARNSAWNRPWVEVGRPEFASITGGVPLADATALPEGLRDMYVFADWSRSTVYAIDSPPANPPTVGLDALNTLQTGAAGPVRFRVGPDGALYELSINVGELSRIVAAQ